MASKKSGKCRLKAVVVESGEAGGPCGFCHRDTNDEVGYGKLYSIGDIYCHYYCALLSCCLVQRGDDDVGLLGFLYRDIQAEIQRGKKHRCSFCSRTGATLGCAVKQCKKQFHAPCGRERNAVSQFCGTYKSYCEQHAPRQQIADDVMERVRARQQLERKRGKIAGGSDESAAVCICVVCCESVRGAPHTQTFWPPCCARDMWLHRTCLERMTLSAGAHYLKCPLCNDKPRFYREVLSQGYYVPDRDAAWELERGAFAEQYSRRARCTAEPCVCPAPAGREQDDDEGPWVIRQCLLCGGGGWHAACLPRAARCVCAACAPAAQDAEQMDRLERALAEELEREQAAARRAVTHGPIMPSRMSIRRTKGAVHKGPPPEPETANTKTAELSNTAISRLELNLKPPKPRRANLTPTARGAETKLLSPLKGDEIQSPVKYLQEKLVVVKVSLDSKVAEKLRRKFKKPRPLKVKREMLNAIYNEFLNDASRTYLFSATSAEKNGDAQPTHHSGGLRNKLVIEEESNAVKQVNEAVEHRTKLVEHEINLVNQASNAVEKESNLVKQEVNAAEQDIDAVEQENNLVKQDINAVEQESNLVDEINESIDSKVLEPRSEFEEENKTVDNEPGEQDKNMVNQANSSENSDVSSSIMDHYDPKDLSDNAMIKSKKFTKAPKQRKCFVSVGFVSFTTENVKIFKSNINDNEASKHKSKTDRVEREPKTTRKEKEKSNRTKHKELGDEGRKSKTTHKEKEKPDRTKHKEMGDKARESKATRKEKEKSNRTKHKEMGDEGRKSKTTRKEKEKSNRTKHKEVGDNASESKTMEQGKETSKRESKTKNRYKEPSTNHKEKPSREFNLRSPKKYKRIIDEKLLEGLDDKMLSSIRYFERKLSCKGHVEVDARRVVTRLREKLRIPRSTSERRTIVGDIIKDILKGDRSSSKRGTTSEIERKTEERTETNSNETLVDQDDNTNVLSPPMDATEQPPSKPAEITAAPTETVEILNDSVTQILDRANSATEIIDRANSATEILDRANSATQILDRANSATEILDRSNSATEILDRANSATQILDRANSETEILDQDESTTSTFELPPEFIADSLSDDDLTFDGTHDIHKTPEKYNGVNLYNKNVNLAEKSNDTNYEPPKSECTNVTPMESETENVANNNSIHLLEEAPKKSTSINIDTDSSLEISEQNERVNIVHKHETPKASSEFTFVPANEQNAQRKRMIDLERFKKTYLSEVGQCGYKHKHENDGIINKAKTFKTAINFAKEAAELKEDEMRRKLEKRKMEDKGEKRGGKKRKLASKRYNKDKLQIKVVYNDSNRLNENENTINLTIESNESEGRKRKKKKYENISIRNKGTKLKIQWKTEKQKKKRKLDISPTSYKQTVLSFGGERDISLTLIKKKRDKKIKSEDTLKQTSIQSFFAVKSPD